MPSRTVAAAIAALSVAGLLLAGCGSSDSTSASTSTSTPGSESTTTTSARPSTTSSSSSTTPTAETAVAVFPNPAGSLRFDDPVDAAAAFATDYVGFVSPEIGDLREVDASTGEVDVRPSGDGPVTVVSVRELDDSWWVLGSATANIVVSEPAPLAAVTSPLALAGTSTAFEATVDVRVREDGSTMPIGEGFVMGGANGVMGPFTGSVTFDAASVDAGAVLFTTSSMESGDIWEATVVRVTFSG